MSDTAFYWIGVGVSLTVAATLVLVCLIILYAWLIHGRFSWIPFRKSQRRLSIASWYNARLMNDTEFMVDDFPIGPRPLYISYKIGNHRLFILIGRLEQYRHASIHGKHPEHEGDK
jgi:hypothetical protein